MRNALLCAGMLLASVSGLAAERRVETAVEKPRLVLAGTFRYPDARVKDRDFHLAIELKPDGGIAGSFESWVEKRFVDKPPQVAVLKVQLSGKWELKDDSLQLSMDADELVPAFKFADLGGLPIRATRTERNKGKSSGRFGENGAETMAVEKPELNVAGTFRSRDGRVKDHDFALALALRSDGSLAGSYESWLEARGTDGRSHLAFFPTTLTGKWTYRERGLEIRPAASGFMPAFSFGKFGGLSIRMLPPAAAKEPPQRTNQ